MAEHRLRQRLIHRRNGRSECRVCHASWLRIEKPSGYDHRKHCCLASKEAVDKYSGFCLDCGYQPIGRDKCPIGGTTCVWFKDEGAGK